MEELDREIQGYQAKADCLGDSDSAVSISKYLYVVLCCKCTKFYCLIIAIIIIIIPCCSSPKRPRPINSLGYERRKLT